MKVAVERAAKAFGVAVAMALVTWFCFRVFPVNPLTAGFLYLIVVLVAATFCGLRESIVTSVAAVLCFNFFFLPPVFHFTIADPQNWVALFAFLTTAILVSKLSSNSREKTKAALASVQEMERLYALSRAILLSVPNDSIGRQAALQIAQTFEMRGVSLYERSADKIHRAGAVDMPEWDDPLREVALQGIFLRDEGSGTVVTAVRLGADPIGSMALRGHALSDSAMQALANLVAIALERARTLEMVNRAELARQSEELKSTLLDAIAHEFKTPLTSIKAATTALLSSGSSQASDSREMLTIIDEEADRMGNLVTEAIRMSRIEAGRIHLRRGEWNVARLIGDLMATLDSAIAGHPIMLDLAADLPNIDVDGELLDLALRQLLDNAAKYSPARTPITITSRLRDNRVLIAIRDEGKGIAELEQSRIFEKFYRGAGGSAVAGSGLGLSIAREIVQANDGQIWVESSAGHGSEFSISLPPVSGAVAADE